MTDFSKVSHEDTVQEEAVHGGGFVAVPVEDGPALIRLREVIELGMVQEDYQGKPKKNLTRKMKVVFEAVHAANGSHAITKEDGTHVRNKDITLYLNKSFNEKAKYRKLFNKMNYNGAVPVSKGTRPSMHTFLGQGFLVDIRNNKSEKNGKTYTNIDNESGEFTIRRAATPVTDPTTGMLTGEVKDIAVPEMEGAQRCFLWESAVSDEVLKQMWDSIYVDGTYEKDGVEHSLNFSQLDIMNPEKNAAWEGSREQALLAGDAIDADLAAGLAAPEPAAEEDAPFEAEEAPAAEETDPLAALGL